ncbi:hypothetical protein Golob_006357 [Gossypium lobatum]|uniref:Uncharacterized protein n=1 Tax=Gossypium lobatum TaxID=34289 RepID=A0A7J8MW11_9ROSI|nr:hypothetical protein [Gossypium lobatum]
MLWLQRVLEEMKQLILWAMFLPMHSMLLK